MTLRIKYHIVKQNGSAIRALSLNRDGYLAMASGSDEDWLQVQKFDENLNLIDVPIQNQDRRQIQLMAWSANGTHLATASDKLTVWEYKNQYLNHVKTFQTHKLELTAISWAPDSLKIASTSLDGRLCISTLTGEDDTSVEVGQKSVGVAWDPYDKYIACLKFDNAVVFYQISNLKAVITIELNFPGGSKKYTTKREDRKMEWSPDCRYLLVPNLDDRLIPTVCALDRNTDFTVTRTFIGPYSSINVIRFSPQIYEDFQVFAIGDNDGNISVWRLNKEEKPLFLIKGHQNGAELIEDLAWSADGRLLVASTSKKYVILIDLQNTLGQPLNSECRTERIKQLYGNTKNPTNGDFSKIRVFNHNKYKITINEATQIQEEKQVLEKINGYGDHLQNKLGDPNNNTQFQSQAPSQSQTPQIQGFKTIIENGKKRMIPVTAATTNQTPTHNAPIIEQPLILIKQLQVVPRNYAFQLSNGNFINLEQQKISRVANQNGTLLKCHHHKEVAWVDFVEGNVKLIQQSKDFIIVYTDANLLYIENELGMRRESPFLMPFLSHIQLANDCLLTIATNGDLKVLDLKNRKIIMTGDLKIVMKAVIDWMEQKKLLSEEEKKGKIAVDPVLKAHLRGQVPEILMKDYQIYSFDPALNQWMRIRALSEMEDPLKFNFNHYPLPIQNDSSLYLKLIQQQPYQDAISDVQQISSLEERLLVDQSQISLQIYVKKLCDTYPMNQDKLKLVLIKYVIPNRELQDSIKMILRQYPRASHFIELIEINQ